MNTTSPRLTKREQQLAEMLTHFQPLNPSESPTVETHVLAPLLAPGDFLNVSGEAGCGKTTLAADILLGFAHPGRKGAALGGLFQFNPVYCCCGNVGIMDAETAPQRWQSLLSRKMQAEQLDPLLMRGVIEYVHPSDLGLHRAPQWRTTSPLVADALAAKRITFVIIDSLSRTWAPDELSSTAWVQQGMAPFRSACQAMGITVLALTHTKRRGDGPNHTEAVGPLGTSMQEAQADAQVMMTINSDGQGCRLKLRKSRRAFWIPPGTSVSLDFTAQFGYRPHDGWEALWPHECPDEINGPEDNQGIRAQILKLFEDALGGALKSTAIAAALGCSSHTATNHLSALEDSRRVIREGSGPATQWRLRP